MHLSCFAGLYVFKKIRRLLVIFLILFNCYLIFIYHNVTLLKRVSETPKPVQPPVSFLEICEKFGIDPNENITTERYFINVTRSNAIGSYREVPDTRPRGCSTIPYNIGKLPSASVIIQVHEEPWSTLLRTVLSVLVNTPEVLLREIIVIDDVSTHPSLKAPLSEYLKQIPKVKLLRSSERLGVIRARQFGVLHAVGDVLVYVDSHCEVNKGWIEPMLYEIARYYKTATAPILDIIDSVTLHYVGVMNYLRGGFTWNLGFKFTDIPTSAKMGLLPMDSYPTPALMGATFAISRRFLLELGGFDTSMKTWGGEDVELSLRVWLCGGRLMICPCSRVGHVFKAGHVYNVNARDNFDNIICIAEYWLESYKKYFYAVTGGSLAPRVDDNYTTFNSIKKTLNCRSFGWYIQNVFPELGVPPEGAIYYGPLISEGLCLGLETDDDYVVNIFNCFSYRSKNIALLRNGKLRIGKQCISPRGNILQLENCYIPTHGNWSYTDRRLRFNKTQCLWVENRKTLHITSCADRNSTWNFRYKLVFNKAVNFFDN